jgi:hypothetical protein
VVASKILLLTIQATLSGGDKAVAVMAVMQWLRDVVVVVVTTWWLRDLQSPSPSSVGTCSCRCCRRRHPLSSMGTCSC